MAVKIFRINYKSDFILTLNSDAGWMTPFCIKFWTDAPSRAFFAGWDGTTYTNCAYDPSEPTKLQVQFDDHHLPVGDLKFQIGYHFTVADFQNDTEDEVINPANVITEIDGEEYQVMLDFTGETAPEIQFSLPAYANEVARIENELQRQENELARQEAELEREQATAAAVQGAENVNAQLNGTTLTVTNRNGVSVSKNVQGPQGIQGPKGDTGATGATGPQGPKGETGATPIIDATASVDDNVGIPMVTVDFYGPAENRTFDFAFKNLKGEQGVQGPQGIQGPQGEPGEVTEAQLEAAVNPIQVVSAQAFAQLQAELEGLKVQLQNLGECKAKCVDSEDLPKVCGASLVIEGSGAPSVVPMFVGQRYHDTVGKKVYEAMAVTNSTANWTLLN